jgi:hypothetical protein
MKNVAYISGILAVCVALSLITANCGGKAVIGTGGYTIPWKTNTGTTNPTTTGTTPTGTIPKG